MAWIAYSAGDAILVGVSTDTALKITAVSGGTTKRLYEKTVTTTKEWRSLTQASAETQAVHPDHNSDSRAYADWTPFTGLTFVKCRVSGTKKTAEVSRQNEANAFRLVVRSTVTSSEVV